MTAEKMLRRTTMFLVLTLGAGCDDGEVGSYEEFSEEAGSILCAYSYRCDGLNDVLDYGIFCHPGGSSALFDDAGLLPNTHFDKAAARRCLDALEARVDSCSANDPPECDAVVVGTQGSGEACASSGQCGPGLRCVGASSSAVCGGTCEPLVAAGGFCGGDPWACAANLGCDETDTCVPCAGVGESCASTRCQADLFCDSETAECYAADDAEGRPCAPGPVDRCPAPTDCNPDTLRCERHAMNLRRGPGDACEPGECMRYHVCDGGTCVTRPLEGEACDESLQCLVGQCLGGTCRLAENGAACRAAYECGSLRCAGGVCTARASLGEACEFDGDCALGLDCATGVCIEEVHCE